MQKYSFLSLSGLAPQVITEAAWSLARQHYPPLVPSKVEVIATGVGEAYGRAQLLGEPRTDPISGQPVPEVADRWSTFCQETFGHYVPIRFNCPTVGGQPLADITGIDADRRFADLCYRLVAEHTAPDQPPLIGSMAGGRKTLGAHLMTAFAVYARPQDRLIHVLVHPASAERDPQFFYPHPGTDVRVHRVDVPFPRLRTVITAGSAADPVRDALARGVDLRDLLAVVQPLLDAERTPDTFALSLRNGHALLTASLSGEEISVVRLTPAEAATFLVVANQLEREDDSFRLDALIGSAAIETQRMAVLAACNRFEPLRPWSTPADVSKAISRLNRSLARSPLIARFFSVESDVMTEATYYRWAEPLSAPLSIMAPESPETWPFSGIPMPHAL